MQGLPGFTAGCSNAGTAATQRAVTASCSNMSFCMQQCSSSSALLICSARISFDMNSSACFMQTKIAYSGMLALRGRKEFCEMQVTLGKGVKVTIKYKASSDQLPMAPRRSSLRSMGCQESSRWWTRSHARPQAQVGAFQAFACRVWYGLHGLQCWLLQQLSASVQEACMQPWTTPLRPVEHDCCNISHFSHSNIPQCSQATAESRADARCVMQKQDSQWCASQDSCQQIHA